MALDEYSRKRNFALTAEPLAQLGATTTGRSFVVQKHRARQLHYDFRLELDGVLKSWSLPKGPSFDPAAKRLSLPRRSEHVMRDSLLRRSGTRWMQRTFDGSH